MSIQSNHYPETLEQEEPDRREMVEGMARLAIKTAVTELLSIGYDRIRLAIMVDLCVDEEEKRLAGSNQPVGSDPIPL